jgi:hypothetical protein
MRVAYVILLDFSCILEEVEQSTLTSELNNFEDNQNGRNSLEEVERRRLDPLLPSFSLL